MLEKRLEFDPHAARRMDVRDFTHADVRYLLELGFKDKTWTPEGGEQRWLTVGNLPDLRRVNRRELVIVFLENAQRYFVITVEWWDIYRRML